MTKISKKALDPRDFGFYVNNLWSAFTLLTSKADIRLLFKDLFTNTEYKMFAKRLEIARRLLAGSTYEEIQHDLNVTSGTVTRVNEVLAEKGDGLRKAHEKLDLLEAKYLKIQRERIKNLENPFRQKTKRKTLGGALLKAGVIALDQAITNKLKENSAKEELPL